MIDNTDVLIIGGGPAGISAAIWCSRLGLKHLLIEAAPSLGGQLQNIYNDILDYPGFAGKSKDLKKQFRKHLHHLNCTFLLETKVININTEKKSVLIRSVSESTEEIGFKFLIFASGASSRKLNIAGEKEMIKRNEVYSASRDSDKFKDKQVAVIGGGDRALEGSLLLAEKGANVYLIHRSEQFRARQEYLIPAFKHPNITVLKNATVQRIHGTTHVNGIDLLQHGSIINIAVEAVFIRIGVEPNIKALPGNVPVDKDGYILVNNVGQSKIPSIFAIGDVTTRPIYSSIASSVGQGMTAAKQISLLLEGSKKQLT
ncbi:NAD(P)/FAD-dependent oxidoreductase [Pseudalkalibacillus caeni]|uniref:NAD(P)/FAD-dependent oxidoreductase n=1 Tax=Exobacillus caeni TaxID=2574798 RepID=A0A5R9F2U4_9BACL|nr:NAD(P)/FAD-dependent oxidoreductase [Pseudalkalibacillus caeni]TLS35868.1 NAD(P)/FAD-dependent oxidoreductase [Pseudalkalibacillus caeni]